jgi:hypothetical protein
VQRRFATFLGGPCAGIFSDALQPDLALGHEHLDLTGLEADVEGGANRAHVQRPSHHDERTRGILRY